MHACSMSKYGITLLTNTPPHGINDTRTLVLGDLWLNGYVSVIQWPGTLIHRDLLYFFHSQRNFSAFQDRDSPSPTMNLLRDFLLPPTGAQSQLWVRLGEMSDKKKNHTVSRVTTIVQKLITVSYQWFRERRCEKLSTEAEEDDPVFLSSQVKTYQIRQRREPARLESSPGSVTC